MSADKQTKQEDKGPVDLTNLFQLQEKLFIRTWT